MRRMSSMTIRAEFSAGGTIDEVLTEMCRVSNLLGVWISATVNEVEVLASPTAKPEALIACYGRAVDYGMRHASA